MATVGVKGLMVLPSVVCYMRPLRPSIFAVHKNSFVDYC